VVDDCQMGAAGGAAKAAPFQREKGTASGVESTKVAELSK